MHIPLSSPLCFRSVGTILIQNNVFGADYLSLTFQHAGIEPSYCVMENIPEVDRFYGNTIKSLDPDKYGLEFGVWINGYLYGGSRFWKPRVAFGAASHDYIKHE